MSDREDDNQNKTIDLRVDLAHKCLQIEGKNIYLTPRFLKVIKCVHGAAPFCVERGKILAAVWGHRSKDADDSIVDQTIRRLNQKLLPHALQIENEPRVGYRIERIQRGRVPQKAEQLLLDQHQETVPYDGSKRLGTSAPRALETLPEGGRSNRLFEDSRNWRDFISAVSRPSEDAKRFADRFSQTVHRPIGPTIELFAHPYLESNLPLAETGWSASAVTIVQGGMQDPPTMNSHPLVAQAFIDNEKLRAARLAGSALEGKNNAKYGIAGTSTPFLETSNLRIIVKETDYFSVARTRPGVEKHFEIRSEFGELDPRKNKIPQAAAIHFIALFRNQEILTIKRDEDTFSMPGTWSFSGEEQLAEIDMQWQEEDCMRRAMLRTAQEELFPLSRIDNKEKLLQAMSLVEPYIKSMRLWSLILEEPTATFSLFCVYEIDLSIEEYKALVLDWVNRRLGQLSREGLYFAVNVDQAIAILRGNTVVARPIFAGRELPIETEKLHPTSRYRLVTLLDLLQNNATRSDR